MGMSQGIADAKTQDQAGLTLSLGIGKTIYQTGDGF